MATTPPTSHPWLDFSGHTHDTDRRNRLPLDMETPGSLNASRPPDIYDIYDHQHWEDLQQLCRNVVMKCSQSQQSTQTFGDTTQLLVSWELVYTWRHHNHMQSACNYCSLTCVRFQCYMSEIVQLDLYTLNSGYLWVKYQRCTIMYYNQRKSNILK